MTSCSRVAAVCASFGLASLLPSTAIQGQTPFRVKAGAPANSLVVDDSTRAQVGIGTDDPTTNLHIESDIGPRIRLHNTPLNLSWDMFVADGHLQVSNLSTETTPFIIENGANNNSLVISDIAKGAANAIGSRIGMGTLDPQKDLHIVGDDLPTIRIESTFS
ncbi:MAG: hypothetical protein KDA75_21390, partial [Planctomycetaceae bacterium]|nr:hypothetical protein [Planctomycetaceae bacterium]